MIRTCFSYLNVQSMNFAQSMTLGSSFVSQHMLHHALDPICIPSAVTRCTVRKLKGFLKQMLDLNITGMCKGVPVCPSNSNGEINGRFNVMLILNVIFTSYFAHT